MSHEISINTNMRAQRRSFDRLYVSGGYTQDPKTAESNFKSLIEVGNHQDTISRCVFRGVVSQEVMEYMLNSEFFSKLEVAVPLRDFTGDSSWIIYFGYNKPGREAVVKRDDFIKGTVHKRKGMCSIGQRLGKVTSQGFQFINKFNSQQVLEIYDLWRSTFDWGQEEIDGLQKKDVRFGAIAKEGHIVSVVMAERAQIEARNGLIDLVEVEGGVTKEGYAGKGLMTAVIAYISKQIIADLPNPIIYAECNLQSWADRAAAAAGFVAYPNTINGREVRQVLVQNVGVNDGQPAEKSLRDFLFMFLPKDVIESQYMPLARNEQIK